MQRRGEGRQPKGDGYMRNMIPCPRPNGTNHERLYLVRAPQLALDAAMDPDDGAQAQRVCPFFDRADW
jgi:hypothetical protein